MMRKTKTQRGIAPPPPLATTSALKKNTKGGHHNSLFPPPIVSAMKKNIRVGRILHDLVANAVRKNTKSGAS
jgi:hypothetical protein